MLPNKILALLLAFLNVSFWALGQQPEQYVYTHYRLTDGLASNIVHNVVQDKRGFIWLSTNSGLQRFDGNKFITFKSIPGIKSSLPSDEIIHVYIDRQNRLWVLTSDNRSGIFNTHTFQYSEVPLLHPGREKVYIDKTFIETASGKLLLHYRKTNRLLQFDAAKNLFVPSTEIHFPQHQPVNYILPDKLSQKYFMATDSGFAIYNPQTRRLSEAVQNTENEPVLHQLAAERFVNFMHIDADRQLYFEQWPKTNTHPILKVYNLQTGARKEFNLTKDYGLGYHQVRGMLEQHNGRRWVYGLPFLAEYTKTADPLLFLKKDYNKEKDLKFNQVFSLSEDRQQNIWVCTDYGVYLFNPDAQLFHNYTLTNPRRFAVEGKAQTAFQFPSGELWIGYRDLGLYRYTADLHPLPLPAAIVPYQDMKSVWDIHFHQRTKSLWIALQGGRLIVYDTVSRKAKLLSLPPFEQRAITQIEEDNEGNLWFATQAGNLVKWDYKTNGKTVAEAFRLVKRTGIIEKLFIDNHGYLWVTAVGEGLLKIDPATGEVITQISLEGKPGYRLWNNNPKDIIQYNDSLLVVATGALSVVNLRTHAVRHISNQHGLPTNTVQSLALDKDGMLWMGTMNGLCVADLNKLSFAVYDQSDGLLNDQFNVAGAHVLIDGRLLFTSAESFVIFAPSALRKKREKGQAYITDFKLLNTSLRVDSLLALKEVNLPHNNTYIAIEFSAFNYSKLTKLDYYYQLQGFDTTWIKSDGRHQAIYTSLSPGRYFFKLKTKNLAGDLSPETLYLTIRVHPPFWLTWWFFSLLLLAIAGILYLLYRERIKRLVTLHNVRTDIASHLHQDVSTTLNNINVLSHIARLKADKDILRSKELIDEISGKSYNMMISMDEILWSIDPGNDTMEKTLLRIFEYAKTLETTYGTSIDIMVHQKVRQLRLNMRVRHDFFIVCKAALQYLAQYANDKSIMMDIDLVWSKIILKILRVGDETDASTAHMLELKKRLEEHAKAMHASLAFDTGKRDTSIVLSIPVK